MTLFTDNFVGTAGTLLSTRPGWAVAGSGTNVTELDGSAAVKTVDASNVGCAISHDTGATDHYCEVVAGSSFAVPNGFPLCTRLANRTTGYFLRFNTAGPNLWEIFLNASSRIAFVAGTWSAGDTIRFQAVGSVLSVFQNANPIAILTQTNTVNATQTMVGILGQSNTAGDPWLAANFQADVIAANNRHRLTTFGVGQLEVPRVSIGGLVAGAAATELYRERHGLNRRRFAELVARTGLGSILPK